MCGRYSLAPGEFSQLRLEFQVELPLELAPRSNIAPTWAPGGEPMNVTRNESGRRELGLARFWMIPRFWKQPLARLPTAFNARAEEASTRPFWASSLETRRCLVPATGWREFTGSAGARRPFRFHFDGAPFAFAGIWDEWQSPEGETARSFAIITVPASDIVAPVHDRMPLCVASELYSEWLDPELSGEAALGKLRSAARAEPAVYESSTWGNDARHDDARCIAPRDDNQLSLFGSQK